MPIAPISIASVLSEKHANNRAHPEVTKERLRMIVHLTATEPEKYMRNRWELNRMALLEALDLTPAEYDYVTTALNREAKSERDAEILRLYAEGLSGRAIGKKLGLVHKTVHSTIRRHLNT